MQTDEIPEGQKLMRRFTLTKDYSFKVTLDSRGRPQLLVLRRDGSTEPLIESDAMDNAPTQTA